MARLSLDNGNKYLLSTDLDDASLVLPSGETLGEEIERLWGQIVEHTDDAAREATNDLPSLTGDDTTAGKLEWLCRYLERAPHDLVLP